MDPWSPQVWDKKLGINWKIETIGGPEKTVAFALVATGLSVSFGVVVFSAVGVATVKTCSPRIWDTGIAAIGFGTKGLEAVLVLDDLSFLVGVGLEDSESLD